MPQREKISQFAKARLIEAYQNDEDFLESAKLLKIKRETAYTSIARKDNDLGQHGGKRYSKIDEIEILGENSSITLNDPNLAIHTGSKMLSRTFLRACGRTIYRVYFCDTKLYRVKYNLFMLHLNFRFVPLECLEFHLNFPLCTVSIEFPISFT